MYKVQTQRQHTPHFSPFSLLTWITESSPEKHPVCKKSSNIFYGFKQVYNDKYRDLFQHNLLSKFIRLKNLVFCDNEHVFDKKKSNGRATF